MIVQYFNRVWHQISQALMSNPGKVFFETNQDICIFRICRAGDIHTYSSVWTYLDEPVEASIMEVDLNELIEGIENLLDCEVDEREAVHVTLGDGELSFEIPGVWEMHLYVL